MYEQNYHIDTFDLVRNACMDIRMDEKRNQAEQLFASLGLTLKQAIDIFISQSLIAGGLPFEVRNPRYSYPETDDMNGEEDSLLRYLEDFAAE